MTNLNNALTSISNSLDANWSSTLISQIDTIQSPEQNKTLIETELLSKLEPILANLFDDLNKSVIEGEYANDLSNANLLLMTGLLLIYLVN
jgi:hypothetical protein